MDALTAIRDCLMVAALCYDHRHDDNGVTLQLPHSTHRMVGRINRDPWSEGLFHIKDESLDWGRDTEGYWWYKWRQTAERKYSPRRL
jgi:hypothetical protein